MTTASDAPATSSFKSPLRCEDNADGTRTLLEPFIYEIGRLGSSWTIVVPAGFVTDGASIPRIMRPLISPWEQHIGKAAVLHDWLYFQGVQRFLADVVLYLSMGVLNAPYWKRVVTLLGVALGGWMAYNAHRAAGHGWDVDMVSALQVAHAPPPSETDDEAGDGR